MTKWMVEIATSHKTLLAMTEQEKIQIPLTPFAKGGNDSWVTIFIIIWYCKATWGSILKILSNKFPHWGGLGGCAFISLFTFNRSCIYEIDSTCHGMSLHYKKIGRNTLRPSILYSLVGAWFIMPVYFQDRPSCCFAAPDEDENTNPGIVSPFSKGG